MSKPRIVVCANAAWNLYNFRMPLLDGLKAEGYDVCCAAPPDAYAERIGYPFYPVPMSVRGTNPFGDLLLLHRLERLYRDIQPSVVLNFTPKPNIYGAVAAHRVGVPCINNIAGLGAVFITENIVSRIVRGLYRFSQPKASFLFFQNHDDMSLFMKKGWGTPDRAVCIPGSGVDLERFLPHAEPEGSFRFLLLGRLLWDKGVQEFIEAARIIRQKRPDVTFQLLGRPDYPNPASVGWKAVHDWEQEGIVTHLGASDDVRKDLAQAHCVVLPSYREGVPRSLLEAMAMERPIITTNAVGCRDVIDDGVNGFECATRDVTSLSDCMVRMVSLSLDERRTMGREGRLKVEREFDVKKVVWQYQKTVEALVNRGINGA